MPGERSGKPGEWLEQDGDWLVVGLSVAAGGAALFRWPGDSDRSPPFRPFALSRFRVLYPATGFSTKEVPWDLKSDARSKT
jgi:hypothetical protein